MPARGLLPGRLMEGLSNPAPMVRRKDVSSYPNSFQPRLGTLRGERFGLWNARAKQGIKALDFLPESIRAFINKTLSPKLLAE